MPVLAMPLSLSIPTSYVGILADECISGQLQIAHLWARVNLASVSEQYLTRSIKAVLRPAVGFAFLGRRPPI
jgi:hypothetical protein